MTTDKIAEIKRRHLTGERYGPATAAHDDRATLLAEVERLRADLLRLCDEAIETSNKASAEIERLRYVLRDTAEDLESSDPTPHKLLAGIIRKTLEGAP